jgi:hypothetical protein
MSDQLTVGDISLDAKRNDPRLTWIEVMAGDSSLAGHVLVETTQIEALGSFEDARGRITEALQALVADRGFDVGEHESRHDALELRIA